MTASSMASRRSCVRTSTAMRLSTTLPLVSLSKRGTRRIPTRWSSLRAANTHGGPGGSSLSGSSGGRPIWSVAALFARRTFTWSFCSDFSARLYLWLAICVSVFASALLASWIGSETEAGSAAGRSAIASARCRRRCSARSAPPKRRWLLSGMGSWDTSLSPEPAPRHANAIPRHFVEMPEHPREQLSPQAVPRIAEPGPRP